MPCSTRFRLSIASKPTLWPFPPLRRLRRSPACMHAALTYAHPPLVHACPAQRDGQFLNGHDLFLKRVGAAYHGFLEEAERACRAKCGEDLQSTTRYVTWSLHTKSRASLKSMLSRVRALGLF